MINDGRRIDKRMRWIIFFIATIGCPMLSMGQLSVDNEKSPEELVRSVLLGSGLSISNVEFFGNPEQFAFFENQNSALSFESGVLMTTGRSIVASTETDWSFGAGGSTNNRLETFDEGFIGIGGDEDLSRISGGSTLDAAYIEFDFIPSESVLEFNYVFASEEYPKFQCAPSNDLFAFLIEGPGYEEKTNIALVPGTDLPVAINSINDGVLGTTFTNPERYCSEPLGSLNFTEYYVDNIDGNWIEFNGMTTTLTARAEVIPCEVYRIKIVVADVFDEKFDSGVFLQAKSFTAQSFNIEGSTTDNLENTIEGCSETTVNVIYNQVLQAPTPLDFRITGTAIQGVDYEAISDVIIIPQGDSIASFKIIPLTDDIQEGRESVIIEVKNGDCSTYDTLIVYINEPGKLSVVQDSFFICSDDASTFNLEAVVLDGDTSGHFSWNPIIGIDATTSRITDLSIDTSRTYTVQFDQGTCSQVDSIFVIDSSIDHSLNFNCINISDTGFELNYESSYELDRLEIIVNETTEYNFAAPELIQFDDFPDNAGEMVRLEITAFYKDQSLCFDGVMYNLSCKLSPCGNRTLNYNYERVSCDPPMAILSLDEEFMTYEWNTQSESSQEATFVLRNASMVRLYVEDQNECRDSMEVFVDLPNLPVIISEVQDVSCHNSNDGSIALQQTSDYDVDWSNGSKETQLDHLSPGTYSVTLTNTDDCKVTDSFILTNPEQLEVDLLIEEPKCHGAVNGTIEIIPIQGNMPFDISINGEQNAALNIGNIMSGDYVIGIIDSKGCKLDTLISISQPDQFSLITPDPITANHFDTVEIIVSTENGQGNVDYAWEIPNYLELSCYDCASPKLVATTSETLVVHAMDELGCKDQREILLQVSIDYTLNIPTAFSPNGDGINDGLNVFGVAGSVLESFNVYDRYGGLVHSSTNIEVNNSKETIWNGTYRGENLSQGTYVWTARVKYLDNSYRTVKGTIALLR